MPAPRNQSVCRSIRRRSCSPPARSEEHTSELQSQSNLVCRLLLEKKKNRMSASNRHTPKKDSIVLCIMTHLTIDTSLFSACNRHTHKKRMHSSALDSLYEYLQASL